MAAVQTKPCDRHVEDEFPEATAFIGVEAVKSLYENVATEGKALSQTLNQAVYATDNMEDASNTIRNCTLAMENSALAMFLLLTGQVR